MAAYGAVSTGRTSRRPEGNHKPTKAEGHKGTIFV